MTIYTVTTSNYNSASFWSAISESSPGHVLDFTGLPASFQVTVQPGSNVIWIWDGTNWTSIGEAGSGSNYTLGAPTDLDYFTEIIVGDANADLNGTSAADTLTSGAGNDNINSGSGNDLIDSGDGADSIDSGLGDDTINAGSGDDFVQSGGGNDLVETGSGNDTVAVSDDHDNDTITDSGGGTDYDTIVFSTPVGTDGVDVVFISGSIATYDYQTTLTNSFGYFEGFEQIITTDYSDTVDTTASVNFQQVFLGGGNDTLVLGNVGSDGYGEAGNDQLTGGSGDDILDGGAGNDTLIGGASQDTLTGGAGGDFLQGDEDSDLADYSASDAAINIVLDGTGAAGTASGGHAQNDTIIGIDELLGSSFNDSLTGYDQTHHGTLSNIIDGGAGNDTIDGRGGNDILRGGTGNDTLLGGDGADTLSGGDGDDYIEGGAGDDLLTTGLGQDTLLGGEGNDTLMNSDGDDSLDGGAGDDSIVATGGKDTLRGGTGADTMDGGDDADTFIIEDAFGNDSITGGEGTTDGTDLDSDTIDGGALTGNVTVSFTGDEAGTITDGADTITFSEIENVFTGSGDDVLDARNDSAGVGLFGGAGSDTITGGTGADYIDGGDDQDLFIVTDGFGNDTIIGGEGGTDEDTIDLSALSGPVTVRYTGNEAGTITNGTDTITFSGIETLFLTEQADNVDGFADNAGLDINALGGDDSIEGGNNADRIDGGTGNDTVFGWGGDDTLIGGVGDDSLDGDTGNDSIEGGIGTDTIIGDAGDDTASGGDGADEIYDSSGANLLSGGEGNDSIFGGSDSDTINGDAGDDFLVGNDGNDLLSGGDGFDTLNGGGGDDTVEGGIGNDWLSGNSGNDTVRGGDGADSVFGAEGHDVMYGDAGNDSMEGWIGNDSMFGGIGDDYIDGATGDDSLEGGEGNDTLLGGSDIGNDTLRGGAGDDSLSAGGGDDILDGGDGADFLFASDGADQLDGGAGNDTLSAGQGNDTINAGTGDDNIQGGDGDDTFVYAAGDGSDTIVDFNAGNTGTLNDGDSTNNDFIDLSGFYDSIFELHADQADDGVLNQSNTTGPKAADYSDNDQFGAGEGIRFNGASADNTSFTSENTGVVCFTTGTAIRTPNGDVLIDDLKVGDWVTTMDNGPQRIAWIGQRHVTHSELAQNARLQPVLIKKGVLGAARDLLVSRQHGMLLGQDHLARATHLTKTTPGVRIAKGKRQVTYVHLMFEAHQIIFAEGIPSESFYPGEMALDMLHCAARKDMQLVFPKLTVPLKDADIVAIYGTTARPFLQNRKAVTAWLGANTDAARAGLMGPDPKHHINLTSGMADACPLA